ncbi:MAG: transcriptional repressor [Candidatus Ancaeobacter aquaticus]|nr:transcriptional repressor [Candidatus Ancaeobacter aquaticus]
MKYQCGKTSDQWHGKMRGGGFRLTIPRQGILDILGNASEHLSAEDIYLKVHRKHPTVGLTTVYRTLEMLVQLGIISKYDFGDGRARYEISERADGKEHHHHLVCSACGKVTDYTDFVDEEVQLLKKTEKGLSKKFNFKITSHVLQFYGLCEKCK